MAARAGLPSPCVRAHIDCAIPSDSLARARTPLSPLLSPYLSLYCSCSTPASVRPVSAPAVRVREKSYRQSKSQASAIWS
eukprot:723530-Rhodomonas_salina.1